MTGTAYAVGSGGTLQLLGIHFEAKVAEQATLRALSAATRGPAGLVPGFQRAWKPPESPSRTSSE